MRPFLWVPVALGALAGVSALVAQSIDGLDVQAVKQRSADLQGEAEAFARQVKDRGEEFREEAAAMGEAGTANMRRAAEAGLPKGPAGPVDFDEIVEGAAANSGAGRGEAPQLIVFASLSMPEQSLRSLINDTAKAGGVVVFRGFPDNSAKAFVARLNKVVGQQDDFANIGIDPRLFRAFDVQSVPTYVAVSSDFDLCAGFSCRSEVPPFDRMIGNVSLGYALGSFVDGGGPGARIAAVGLANLERSHR